MHQSVKCSEAKSRKMTLIFTQKNQIISQVITLKDFYFQDGRSA